MDSRKIVSEDELVAAHLQGQREMEERQLLKYRGSIAAFRELAAKRGAKLSDENFRYIQTIGIIACAPGLLEYLIGPVVRERDRLTSFDVLARRYSQDLHRPGYLCSGQFSLMAHPYFRRAMHEQNNFAPRFVELFWALEQSEVSKYIAFDENRVRVNVDDGYIVELDTWYGAPFNEDISKIPSGLSKLRPPPDLKDSHVSMFFADAYCLDVKWTQEGDIRTFQALEVKSERTSLVINGEKVFPARYIHAEFDVRAGCFRHFDGAIQYLADSEYWQRRDSDFNYNAKNHDQIKSRSTKLFKLNGRIETKTWVEFCCHFFAGNPLVFEYFTGSYPPHVLDTLSRIEAARSQGAGLQNMS